MWLSVWKCWNRKVLLTKKLVSKVRADVMCIVVYTRQLFKRLHPSPGHGSVCLYTGRNNGSY